MKFQVIIQIAEQLQSVPERFLVLRLQPILVQDTTGVNALQLILAKMVNVNRTLIVDGILASECFFDCGFTLPKQKILI